MFFLLQMFESPVTLIESKKQKTVFEDVDGSKVVAYLEKDSPGMPEAKELFYVPNQRDQELISPNIGKQLLLGEEQLRNG